MADTPGGERNLKPTAKRLREARKRGQIARSRDLTAAAAFLAAIAVLAFRRAGTTIDPHRIDKVATLVTSGVFSFTRNPMYLGMTLIYCALAVAADAPVVFWMLIPLCVTIHYGVVLREERYMADRFGTAYIDYANSVPRWL